MLEGQRGQSEKSDFSFKLGFVQICRFVIKDKP